ncbi:MAG: hypothetical protein JNL58_28235 [Planctomyces sp.]|nr:hypothetical protein [Planctomyces sp.]
MPILNCRKCGLKRTTGIPARLVGKRVPCPRCKSAVSITATESSHAIDFPMDDEQESAPEPESVAEQRVPGPFKSGFVPVDHNGARPEDTRPMNSMVGSEPAFELIASGSASGTRSRRRRPTSLFLLILIAICGPAVGAFATITLLRGSHTDWAFGLVPLPPEDPNLMAVREYLRENCDSPEWEEVRYFSGFHMRTDAQWQAAWDHVNVRSSLGEAETFLNWQAALRGGPTVKYVRLKYRITGVLGPRLLDDVFQISDKRAELVGGNLDVILKRAWIELETAAEKP